MATAGGTDDRREGTDDCLEWRHLMRGSASATITARVGRGFREIKKSAFCGETAAAGRIFVAGHVSRRGSSTGTWQLFKVVSEMFTRVSAAVDVLRRFYIQEFDNGRWNDELTQIHTQKLLNCFLHFADAEHKFRCCISYRYFLWCTWPIFFRTLFSSVRFALVASAGFGTRNENWRSLSDSLVLKKTTKHLNLTLKSSNDLGDWEPSWTQGTRLVCHVFLSHFYFFFFCLFQ